MRNRYPLATWDARKPSSSTRTNLSKIQGNCCALCKRELPLATQYTPYKNGIVDHDHGNGHVRGLLCQPCNIGLSYYENNRTLKRKVLPNEYVNGPFLLTSKRESWCRAISSREASDSTLPDLGFVWDRLVRGHKGMTKAEERLFDFLHMVCPTETIETLVAEFSHEMNLYHMEQYLREHENAIH